MLYTAPLTFPLKAVTFTKQLLLLSGRCCVGARCQPADVFGDVLPKLGWGTAEEVEKVTADI